MLQIIRDKIQGVIAGTIAAIIALTFALWGVQNYLRSGSSQVVAEVNGKEITQEMLRMSYEQVKRSEMLRTGSLLNLGQKAQAKLKQDILQQLIEQEVVYRAETKMGLGINKRQLMEVAKSMPIFQHNGHFSPERFRQLMQGYFYSEQVFFDTLEKNILRSQLEKGITDSNFILSAETLGIKKLLRQKRDFGYFIIPTEYFFNNINITPDAVKKYYDENQNEFLLPEQVSIQYIELTSGDLLAKMKATDEELKSFYHSHIESFSTPKKWQVMKILLPLSPKDDSKSIASAIKRMETIARQVGDQKELTDLGSGIKVTTSWVTNKDLSPEFLVELGKLSVGQVSASPIRNKDGLNLIKVIAINPGKAAPYSSVMDKVKQGYERQKLAQAFADASDKLSDMVYTNPDTLEPAARELGLKIKATGFFTNSDGSKEGIISDPKVANAAFSDAVLNQRYNSNLIELAAGRVVVLRVKEHIPERVKPLDQVRNTIIAKLRTAEANKRTNELASKIAQALKDGKNAVDLAKEHSLVWRQVAGVKFGQTSLDQKLVDTAFSLAQPSTDSLSVKVVDLGNGAAIVRLDKVSDDSSEKSDAEAEVFAKFLPRILGSYDYQTLIKNFMAKAKIKITDTSL